MIIELKSLQAACKRIQSAMSANDSVYDFKGLVEFISENGNLYAHIADDEFFVEVNLGACTENFHAVIDADKFIKLVSKFKADTVELSIKETSLYVKVDNVGTNASKYYFPLRTSTEGTVISLPKIVIENVTINGEVDGNIFNNIALSTVQEFKTLTSGQRRALNDHQKYTYIDNEGSITYTNGGCVTKFTLPMPIKILAKDSLVKLFPLFAGGAVKVSYGEDTVLGRDYMHKKLKLDSEENNISITAILNYDDSKITSYPAKAVREQAFKDFEQNVCVNREELLAVLDRMLVISGAFASIDCAAPGYIEFKNNEVEITDVEGNNSEFCKYAAEPTLSSESYKGLFDLNEIICMLKVNKSAVVKLNFGDHQSMVIVKDNVYAVIPELN